jgi:hypothetical protein
VPWTIVIDILFKCLFPLLCLSCSRASLDSLISVEWSATSSVTGFQKKKTPAEEETPKKFGSTRFDNYLQLIILTNCCTIPPRPPMRKKARLETAVFLSVNCRLHEEVAHLLFGVFVREATNDLMAYIGPSALRKS